MFASPMFASPAPAFSRPMHQRRPAIKPIITTRSHADAYTVTVSAPTKHALRDVSVSTDGQDLRVEGRIEAGTSCPWEYVCVAHRCGIYANPSRHSLIGHAPYGATFEGHEPSGGWIRIDDGTWILDDGNIAVKHEPSQVAASPFVKRVSLPSDANLAQASRRPVDGGSLLVTVPRATTASSVSKYVVVHGPRVAVRRGPSTASPLVGSRNKGEVVEGSTDGSGWLRLADHSGFMLLSGRHLGLGTLLAPLPPTEASSSRPPIAPKPPGGSVPTASAPLEPVARTMSGRSSGSNETRRHREASLLGALPKEEPVLVECVSSVANVSSPAESCQHWDATPDGGFVCVSE